MQSTKIERLCLDVTDSVESSLGYKPNDGVSSLLGILTDRSIYRLIAFQIYLDFYQTGGCVHFDKY